MRKETRHRALDISAREIVLPYGESFLREGLRPTPFVPRLTPKNILLVDPDPVIVRDAESILHLLGHLEVCVDFNHARDRLVSNPPDLLVANIRLREYNGLHLVLRARPHTRSIVYATHHDAGLAREAQAAGAFYERSMRLASALVGYLSATLPPRDRRNLDLTDRRQFPRGGRRSSDL